MDAYFRVDYQISFMVENEREREEERAQIIRVGRQNSSVSSVLSLDHTHAHIRPRKQTQAHTCTHQTLKPNILGQAGKYAEHVSLTE